MKLIETPLSSLPRRAGRAARAAHHSFAAAIRRDEADHADRQGHRRSSGPIRTSISIVDVKDEKSGEVVNWAFEMGGPNALIRLGWTRNSLKPDDLVTFEGSLARTAAGSSTRGRS